MKRIRMYSISIVLICVFSLGCNRSSEMPAQNNVGKIAFISYSDSNSEIYVINADGSGLKRLTNSPMYEGLPYWSPDGSQIVYQASEGEDTPSQLYIMNADGSNSRPITNDEHNHSSPSWAPDGTKIAFSGKNGNIHIVNVDGSDEMQVTDLQDHVFLSPTWSPDSKKIAVEGGKEGETIQTEWGEARYFQIWVFTVDRSAPPEQITDMNAYNGYPAWSPKGDMIAFDSTEDGWADIHAVNVHNKTTVNLTNQPTQSEFAAWSSDGSQIAFVANRDGNTEIYIMNADGSNQTRLTFNDADDSGPAWAPF